MITKDHDIAYNELYEEAVRVLKEYDPDSHNVEINTIQQYFNYLKRLVELENEHPNEIDPMFTMIPAYEGTFVIDANTRNITTPPEFVAGVGVQGDDIAEIIYFEIERYFDAVDLATMDILIQWARPGGEVDGTDGNQNLALPYKRSLKLKQGKIVFGWPITEEMTRESGDIIYSIRFYKKELDEYNEFKRLVYSFSTSPARLKIKKGLNFDISETTLNALNLTNMNERIYNNLRGSIAIAKEKVAKPVFQYYRYSIGEGENKVITTITNNNRVLDLGNELSFIMRASVTEVPDNVHAGQSISYEWYKGSSNKFDENTSDVSGEFIQYVSAKDLSYNEFEIYYALTNPDTNTYSNAEKHFNCDIDINYFNSNRDKLYVKESVYAPEVAGYYYCKAINKYGSESMEEVISDPWYVPYPNKPEFVEGYETQTFDENTALTVSLANGVDPKESQTYQWKKLSEENKYIDIAGATEISYHPVSEGKYKLLVTNMRNNAYSTNETNEIEAVHEPAMPNITGFLLNGEEQKVGTVVNNVNANSKLSIQLDTTSNEYYDAITYQWSVGSDIKDENSNEITITSEGMYKCRVTNTYKGKAVTSEAQIYIQLAV